jgi:small nuclear ribonucleoprotein (snRNP)-like protein
MNQEGERTVQRPRHNPYKTLVSYFKYMEGEEVIVELKNGRQIEGVLQNMEDPSMSVTLALPQSHSLTSTTTMPSQSTTSIGLSSNNHDSTNSTETTTTDRTDTTSSPEAVVALHHNRICHIRGSCIRYIHLPNDFVSILRTQQDRERTARQRYQRGIRKT